MNHYYNSTFRIKPGAKRLKRSGKLKRSEVEVNETIGRKLVSAAIKRRVADGSVVGKPWELIDAIDEAVQQAIKDERERCVGIAKFHNENHGDRYHNCGLAIADEITKDQTCKLETKPSSAKSHLIQTGWRYTGRAPHDWSHPDLSPESRPYADALLIQSAHEGAIKSPSMDLSEDGKGNLLARRVTNAIKVIDARYKAVGLDALSPERMAVARVLREVEQIIAITSGGRRPVGTYGTRNKAIRQSDTKEGS